jgi:hypothetical protein
MRRGAFWGLMFGFLGAASPAWAASPEAVSEGSTLPGYDAPIAPPIDAEVESEPISGVGLMVSGPILLVGGGVLLGVSVANYTTIMREEEGLGELGAVLFWTPLIVVGASTVVAGAALLGTGIASHRKHRAWTRGQLDASLRPRMLPTFSLLPGGRDDRVGDVGGFSLGFSGRF